ncbi:type VI secretion system protein TssA [Marinobacter daepoensis]|uniref:Type VI secretion system protein TssA n=1 Tax=Marinobacter daepoensis TaxID=262077 RepID=A0ABS3BC48_9GAMM|nr:type VI secretion system protein TssA [Marinobacter daepoensis]MBN7768441.1 type VI secretion system protein TssA [Marinobacter daepoensis]MBY6080742.1 type VI secretion system protein TssA [Marinobacter daepoensis]
MQVIEQHPYVDQVLSPIPGETGVGESLAEDSALEFLEDEIMKVGSLAHNDIDWPKVESEALKLLADRSKDIKVLGFVMLSLQRGGDGERFALSLYLLHRVLNDWWENAWPYPGAKGQRARKMLFTQILQRALKAVESLSFDASVGDGRHFCLELVDKLDTQAKDRDLPDDALFDLKRAVEKLPKPDQAPAPRAASENATTTRQESQASSPSSGSAGSNGAAASLGNLTLDPGNERATRQSLLKVAELLTSSEPDNPLGYQMRRYAIWQSITSLPPTRDGKRTDLAAVSADRVAEYQETLEKAPDPELWQRIEQSLSVSPFWLDGHWLSARAAMALGHTECAEAIREALKGFVDRLPQLTELTFNDGTPFLGDDATDWMHTAPAAGKGGGAANPWDQAFDSALELVRQNKLAPAMELLEQGLADAREPRERFYWRLATARLLKETGLKALAAEQIQDLKHQVQGRVLDDWEPALIKQLDRLA